MAAPRTPVLHFPPPRLRVHGSLPQEITKLLDGQPGVTNDTAESKGVNRVMAWDRQDARAV